MAAQITLSQMTSFPNKSIPQLFKSDHRQAAWSTRNMTDGLKWGSTPLKSNRYFCKCMKTPHLQQLMPHESIPVKHGQLVEEVRELISNGNDVKFDDMLMVDAIQRLGLDYHYEDEINLTLEQCYHRFMNNDFAQHSNLYEVSLCFRILRQKGFHVSADAFQLFKEKNGKFVEDLKNDIRGLIELYEASHLRIEGENILDEAAKFTSHMLQKTLIFLDDKNARIVRYTLENPSRTHFSLHNSHKEFTPRILKEVAEMEFKMVQSIRRMEVNEILRWWKYLGLGQHLKLARNQPIKWYIVSMAALANPTLSQQRIDLTKVVSLIYIIDDIFDRYGTLDELTLLVEAINMWDIRAKEKLPYHMRESFKALYDTTNEIALNVYERHGFNPIESLQKSWATLCDAFLVEAKWFAFRHVPKTEEYLKNGIVSSGVEVFLVHMFFLLGDGASKEKSNLITNNQGIISSVSKILRLSDDLEFDQDKIEDEHDGSYVKCFIMEREHCSAKIAQEYVRKMVSVTWKCLNKECLSPNPFSQNFLIGSINLARLVPLMYHCGQNNSFDQIEEYIMSILRKSDQTFLYL